MRRISILSTSLLTSIAIVLSGLAFNPANAVDSDERVNCGAGTYRITTVGSVVTISDGYDCTGNVVIPASVTSIGEYAFVNAILLTSVTFEAGSQLGTISDYAFYGTTSLESMIIPASVTSIGIQAFDTASSLTSVTFEAGSLLTSIGRKAFSFAHTLTAIEIPANVESIGVEAFTPMNSLTSVTFAGSGTSPSLTIGNSAFSGASLVTSINIPARVTSIGDYAFVNATSLTSLTIPASVSSIGDYAFNGATSLSSIYFLGAAPNPVGTYAFENLGNSPKAYVNTANASSFTPLVDGKWNGLTVQLPPTDGTYACGDGTYTITTVNSVITFGQARTCTGDVVIPEGVEATTSYIFNYYLDAEVTSVSLPASLYQMGHSGFYGTGLLTEINVASKNAAFTSVDGVLFSLRPDGVSASLYAYPANKVESTYTTPTHVSFAGGSLIPVTTIEGYAFQFAKNLTTLSISQGVTTLGGGIAETATLLSTINLPDSYTAMTGQALSGATGLSALTIGKFLTSIQEGSLNQARNLNSITVHPDNSSYSSLDGVLFNDNFTALIAYPVGKPAASYTIPSGVTTVDKNSFQGAWKLTSVIFPSSISAIESEAFSCASYLTSFVFQGNAPTVGDFAFGCIEAPKAYIKPGNNTFTLDADGKWNRLTVSEFDFFVNFDSKGGSAVSLSPFVTGGSISAPTAPTRDFYGFTGWSTTNSVAEGGTAVTFPYTPSGDITLFANWFEDGSYLCSTGGVRTTETTDAYSIYGGVVNNGSACTGDVVIPEGVTTIGTYAFNNSTITSISLPATLTSIDDSAFAGTTSLVSLTIPEGVVNISEWAFSYSQLLETITLPASIKNIGNTAFQDSLSLRNINVDTDNTDFASVDGVLFNKTLTQLEAYPAGKPATSYTVPASVEIIDDRSFISSGSLKTVLFTPDSELTSLAGSVFQTSGLTSINLPEGVTAIGNAFNSAQNLTSVTLPGSVTSIGAYAFQGSTRLSSFYFLGGPPTVEPETFTNIGPSPKAYIKSENTSFITDGEGKWNGLTVTFFDHFVNYDSNDGSEVSASPFAIGGSISAPTAPTRTGYTFSGWSTTDPGTTVSFPYTPGAGNDITLFANWLEDGNFLCSGARAEVDDTNIYNITGGVVSNGSACTGGVVIPEGVTHIGTSAFGSSPMTSISLPNSLIEIGQQAFLGTGLTTITIPKNVSTMGLGVFQNVFALTSITVAEPNVNYTSSSDGVLFNEGSTNLVAYPLGKTATSYTIPSSVNIIGDRAFMGATLTSVTIPSGVSTVEDLAFFCASSLTSIYFLGDAPGTIGNSSFGCLSAEAKAHVKNANVSSFTLVDGKWNDLTVEIVDPPSDNPPSNNPPAPVVDTAAQLAAADLAARTVGVKKSFAAKALSAKVGIKTVSPKATVTFSIAKSSKKVCSKSGSKIKTLSVGNCVVTFTVQEPKPKKGKKPKATKTVKTLVVQ